MSNILDTIIAHKRREVAQAKKQKPLAILMKETGHRQAPRSMRTAIRNGSGLIAEFKRASPSKGLIRQQADPAAIAASYEKAGASAVSVLTDRSFFLAEESDLPAVADTVELPILRKDFIIDTYQIAEARAQGADCILLIAAALSKSRLAELLQAAIDLGLEALVEVHRPEELDKLCGRETLIGVNNRNLDNFTVDIQVSLALAPMLGDTVVKVTESGLDSTTHLQELVRAGFSGFLVGESLMRSADPGAACAAMVTAIKQAKNAG